jgi:hypothetical protein
MLVTLDLRPLRRMATYWQSAALLLSNGDTWAGTGDG